MKKNILLDNKKTFIGLAPMDGITDFAYRHIAKKYGKVDVLYTEFCNVVGLIRGKNKLYEIFRFDETQRPIIAQLFGTESEYFYLAAVLACYMGFDGIDINMGCPARKVTDRGGGAALIGNREIARSIINSVEKGIIDYKNGKKIKDINTKKYIDEAALTSLVKDIIVDNKREISLSVKTRIGIDKCEVNDWIKFLNEFKLNFIAIHGRTLKQGYSGFANWDEIGKASKISKIPIVGNGDIKSYSEALEKINKYKLKGTLIGRASFGNPWIFKKSKELYKPSVDEIKEVMIDHITTFTKYNNTFYDLRKHMAWYVKGFSNAKELRSKLVLTNSLEEVKGILNTYL